MPFSDSVDRIPTWKVRDELRKARAERDALQARIDAVTAVVQEQKQRNQGPAAKILDSMWMVRSDLLLAALGVDPQKETGE